MFFLLVSVCSLIVFGLLGLAKSLLLGGNTFSAASTIIGAFVLVGIFGFALNKYRVNINLGLKYHDDERTYKVKMYAAGYAYFLSIYLWLAILIFQNFLDRDDIIILGLLGMALSFGMSWLILSKKKGLE